MPKWTPSKEWKGQDAFIVGGGSSLYGFDFGKLRGRNTIGCNAAFRLGPEIIKICYFGDISFWRENHKELAEFKGRVVTSKPDIYDSPHPWLLHMRRIQGGLHSGHMLGWNYSSGAAAINLAISLGSARIYLLGFDMGCVNAASHWHSHYEGKLTRRGTFKRFEIGFHRVAADLKRFRRVVVYNVTDGSSKLEGFPRISFAELEEVLT
jgi:hypothetical protein